MIAKTMEPLPATLAGLDLLTPQQQVEHYKAVERVRQAWERRAIRLAGRRFETERLTVRGAVAAAGQPDAATAAAEGALDRQAASWQAFLWDLYQMIGGDFAARSFRGLKTAGAVRQRKAEDVTPSEATAEQRWRQVLDRYLREHTGQKVRGIIETTREEIRLAVAEGIAGGEGVQDIARRIDRLYLQQIVPHRSVIIARTETIAASNLGSRAGAIATGLALEREWLATPGLRTRPAHMAASGQRRAMEQPYSVSGEHLMFPGDTSLGARARNVVNCRCTEAYRRVSQADQ